jgi:hypothetical protein
MAKALKPKSNPLSVVVIGLVLVDIAFQNGAADPLQSNQTVDARNYSNLGTSKYFLELK